MTKSRRWSCDRVSRSYHVSSDNEFKNLLAEVWDILLASSRQLRNPVSSVFIAPPRHLLKPQRKGKL